MSQTIKAPGIRPGGQQHGRQAPVLALRFGEKAPQTRCEAHTTPPLIAFSRWSVASHRAVTL